MFDTWQPEAQARDADTEGVVNASFFAPSVSFGLPYELHDFGTDVSFQGVLS